jgi:hypothetical protein
MKPDPRESLRQFIAFVALRASDAPKECRLKSQNTTAA